MYIPCDEEETKPAKKEKFNTGSRKDYNESAFLKGLKKVQYTEYTYIRRQIQGREPNRRTT